MLVIQNITFYKVPLVCNSATNIGCGSRSKPILLALEKQSEVKEAWLKRDGTVIGIVWKPSISKNKQQLIAEKIFSENQVEAINLIDNKSLTEMADFNIPNAWYKGKKVNKLSKEEASIIAKQLVAVFDNKSRLNPQQKLHLTKDITNVFYDFFLNYHSVVELADTKVYRLKMEEINKLSEKYILKQQLPKINDLLNACTGHSNC
ncbi:hypothetical protein [Lutibacter sp.]|uniref:hypothetical protein n=1 Tax=Lutibacter sp. TaxID=1925666 RepID=UPI0025BD14EF|nr:hypothetical protein [Lutibacter sp.]MCF6182854.1 hypothetical protein [Lutibacter sp.]